MSAAMKKLVLVLLIAVLPVQALAAIVVPLRQQDVPASVVAVADHTHHDGDHHDHDVPAPGHDHPIAASDFGSYHCDPGSALATPVMATKPPAAPGSERNLFLATSISGYIPEQPQRPPRAVLF